MNFYLNWNTVYNFAANTHLYAVIILKIRHVSKIVLYKMDDSKNVQKLIMILFLNFTHLHHFFSPAWKKLLCILRSIKSIASYLSNAKRIFLDIKDSLGVQLPNFNLFCKCNHLIYHINTFCNECLALIDWIASKHIKLYLPVVL